MRIVFMTDEQFRALTTLAASKDGTLSTDSAFAGVGHWDESKDSRYIQEIKSFIAKCATEAHLDRPDAELTFADDSDDSVNCRCGSAACVYCKGNGL